MSKKGKNKFFQALTLLKPDQGKLGQVFVFFFLVIIMLTFPFAAQASVSISAVSKSRFVFEVQAGAKINTKVIIANTEKKPIEVSIYSVDAVEDKKTGSFLPGNYDSNSVFTKWISEPVSMVLEPMNTQEFLFTISIPSDTPSGQYIGALMAEEKGDSGTININTRVGVRIYLTVLGFNEPVSHSTIQSTLAVPVNPSFSPLPVSPPSSVPKFITAAPLIPLEIVPSSVVPQVSQEYRENTPVMSEGEYQSAGEYESAVQPAIEPEFQSVQPSTPELRVSEEKIPAVNSQTVNSQPGSNIIPIFILIAFVIGLFWMMMRLR